jgi:hypothetical protein
VNLDVYLVCLIPSDPNGGSRGLLQINFSFGVYLVDIFLVAGCSHRVFFVRAHSCLILLLICVLLWLFLNTLRNGTIMVGSLGVNSGII